jgi:serine/threonine protein phosphatase PrpC
MGYEKLSKSIKGLEHFDNVYGNQDAVLVSNGNFGFIADGMGSQGNGNFASRFAIERAHEFLREGLGYISDEYSLEDVVTGAVDWAHTSLGIMGRVPRSLKQLYQRMSQRHPEELEELKKYFEFMSIPGTTLDDVSESGTSLNAWAIDEDDYLHMAWLGNIIAIKFDGKTFPDKLTSEHISSPVSFEKYPLRFALAVSRSPLQRYAGQNIREPGIDYTNTYMKKGDSVFLFTKGITQSVSLWGMLYALSRDTLIEARDIIKDLYVEGDDALMRARSKETGLDLETSRNELAGRKDGTFTMIRRT